MADIILGNDTTTGKPVTMDNKDRVRHMYAIGRTGFGKSVFLEQLAAQDASMGHGFCFLDVAGDVLDHILCRMPQERIDRGDVLYLDVKDYTHPFGLNLYECKASDPWSMRESYNQVEQIFSKIFGMSKDTPRLSMYVRNITATLLYNQGMTMLEIPLLLLDEQFRAKLINNLPIGSPARLFWKTHDGLHSVDRLNHSESTRDRLDGLVNDEILRYIVGQSKTTINFADLMNTGKILLVKLPGDDEQITSLLGSVIINQLLLAALSRKDIPEKKRRQFNIYADEFQRFAVPSFGQLLIEARKYKVALTCANQVLNDLGEQLKPRMLNAGCLVVFNVQDEDAAVLSGEFDYTPPQAIRPPGTIPRKVLPRLEHHQNSKVKEFWREYVVPLEQALKKTERERIARNYLGEEITITTLPTHNFGERVVEYKTDDVQHTYDLLNDILYQVMRNPNFDQEANMKELFAAFAPLLDFQDFYDWHYLGKSWEMVPYLMKATLEAGQQVIALTEEIQKIDGYLVSDDTLVQFCYGQKFIDRTRGEFTLEESYEFLRKEAQKNARHAWIMGTYEGMVWEMRNSIAHQIKQLKSKATPLQKEGKGKLVSDSGFRGDRSTWQGRREWKQYLRQREQRLQDDIKRAQQAAIQQVQEAEQAIQSEEGVFAYIAKYWKGYGYAGTMPDEVREGIQKQLDKFATQVAELRQNDTPEKAIASKRKEYEQKREEKKRAIEIITADLRHQREGRKETIENQRLNYLRLVKKLKEVITVLITDEGRIEVQSTKRQELPTVQQTHTDKRSEISNALTHLPVGQAWVRLTTSDGERKIIIERVIDTIIATGFNQKELERKKTQVVAYTRANYCTPRKEVEEQIRKRQESPDQSPPSTQRKRTL